MIIRQQQTRKCKEIWESFLLTHKKTWETHVEDPLVQGTRSRQWKIKKDEEKETEPISSQSMADQIYQSLSEELFSITQEHVIGNHILALPFSTKFWKVVCFRTPVRTFTSLHNSNEAAPVSVSRSIVIAQFSRLFTFLHRVPLHHII